MIRTTRTRRGVTLVEMMVAAALSIAGMWLLTWVYQQGLDSFRQGRATADLTAQERMVASLMTRDLKAPHFLEEDSKPNRGRRLSDQTKGLVDVPQTYKQPKSGYFWTKSTTVGTIDDQGGVPDTNGGFFYPRSSQHFAQFTEILPGGTNDQTFGVEVPSALTLPNPPSTPTPYFGTAAEVSYFLVPSGKTPNGLVTVYDLYRRQRLVARTTDDAPSYANAVAASNTDAPEVMAVNTTVNPRQMRTLAQLGVQANRLSPFSPLPVGSPRFGEDKLMSGILSLEIKYTGTGTTASGNTPGATVWPTPFNPTTAYPQGNTDYPYDYIPMVGSNPGEFDTHGANPGSLKQIRITGAQIRIRAIDLKTLTARSTTFTVDL